MSQFDQTSTRITATGDVTTQRTRLHSVFFPGSVGGGRITLRNGSVSGTILFDIDVPAGSGASAFPLYMGEESGIVFPNGVHCATLGTTAATLFYSF